MTPSELRDQVVSLLKQKGEGMRVDNRLHDSAVDLALDILKQRFPGLQWKTAKANHPGLDIQGFSEHGTIEIACEVVGHDHYKGHRRDNVDEDLKRLQESRASHKYLAVVHKELASELASSPKARNSLTDIGVICVLETWLGVGNCPS